LPKCWKLNMPIAEPRMKWPRLLLASLLTGPLLALSWAADSRLVITWTACNCHSPCGCNRGAVIQERQLGMFLPYATTIAGKGTSFHEEELLLNCGVTLTVLAGFFCYVRRVSRHRPAVAEASYGRTD
jgi:hypothetical protein